MQFHLISKEKKFAPPPPAGSSVRPVAPDRETRAPPPLPVPSHPPRKTRLPQESEQKHREEQTVTPHSSADRKGARKKEQGRTGVFESCGGLGKMLQRLFASTRTHATDSSSQRKRE
jgi:hypothetical protein